MSIRRDEQEILPEGLSEALDAWEAEPISLDFNRRLYQQIQKTERRRRWRRRIVSCIPLTLLLCVPFIMRVPHPWFKAKVKEHKALPVNGLEFEQAVSDLEMLRQINAKEPL